MTENQVFDVVCIGTAIVDSIIRGFDPNPVSATGYRAASCALHVGGEAVNVSVAAARLGLRAGILCSLGQDAAGALVLQELRSGGVDTGAVLCSDEHPTPVTTMFVREDGTRRSITNEAHKYNFHPERHLECTRTAGAVALGSLFRAPFDDPEVVFQVLRNAKDMGQRTFADTKLPNFRVLSLDDLADSLPLIDCLTPNEDEARFCTGKDRPEEMAEAVLRRGVKSVVIKLGARGCYYRSESEGFYLSAHRIRPMDATGAGDNFLAGLISEQLRGASPLEALRFANACGAICTTEVGACTALRDRAQVLALLDRDPVDWVVSG